MRDQFLISNDHDRKPSNTELTNAYEDWGTGVDQQNFQNYNDPPGAPSTFGHGYPMNQAELVNQSWQSHHDVNNRFYTPDSNPMFTERNQMYDPNQYKFNQSQPVIAEERPSKKVQFAEVLQQSTPSRPPLTGTQSWHEQSNSSNEMSMPPLRHEPLQNRNSITRSAVSAVKISSPRPGAEKPIYVGIDHRATLAERAQHKGDKRRHRTNPETSNSNVDGHRSRSHTHHHHKTQELNNLSTSKINSHSKKNLETSQLKTSNAHRSLITTTSNLTGMLVNTIEYASEPTLSEEESKLARTRHLPTGSSQKFEQQSTSNNPMKSLKNSSHSSQQQQRMHESVNHNSSHVEIRSIRRHENKKGSSSPVMRVSLSRHQQHRSKPTSFVIPPIVNNLSDVTRTAV